MGDHLQSGADNQEQVKVLHDRDTQVGCSTSRLSCYSWSMGTEVGTEVMKGREVLSVVVERKREEEEEEEERRNEVGSFYDSD